MMCGAVSSRTSPQGTDLQSEFLFCGLFEEWRGIIECGSLIEDTLYMRYCFQIFFNTQFKTFYKDELPKTLLTTHYTTLQRPYPREHNILTTLTPFHKRHRTKLKLNIRLQKLHTTNLPISTDIERKEPVSQ